MRGNGAHRFSKAKRTKFVFFLICRKFLFSNRQSDSNSNITAPESKSIQSTFNIGGVSGAHLLPVAVLPVTLRAAEAGRRLSVVLAGATSAIVLVTRVRMAVTLTPGQERLQMKNVDD